MPLQPTPVTSSAGLVRLSQLTPQRMEWLWNWHLPLAKLTLLKGDPGLGKSLVALDLCARVTTGRPLPDGSAGSGPENVLIWTAEDTVKDATLERLRAAGADLDRVHALDNDESGMDPPALPSEIARLDAQLAESRARLFVLDPVVAFLDSTVNTNNDKSVRRALAPLARLAARHRCGVFMILHLNKQPGARALYRGGGSIAFQAASRSSWLVAPHPCNPSRCVMAHVKSNYGPLQPSRSFEKRDGGAAARVRWLDVCDLGPDQLVADSHTGRRRHRNHARELVEDFLADGPRTAEEARLFWENHGLAERTVRRAREELGVQCVCVKLNGQRDHYWLLPGQALPDAIPTSAIECDPEEILRQMPSV